jgi:hypothetical protein
MSIIKCAMGGLAVVSSFGAVEQQDCSIATDDLFHEPGTSPAFELTVKTNMPDSMRFGPCNSCEEDKSAIWSSVQDMCILRKTGGPLCDTIIWQGTEPLDKHFKVCLPKEAHQFLVDEGHCGDYGKEGLPLCKVIGDGVIGYAEGDTCDRNGKDSSCQGDAAGMTCASSGYGDYRCCWNYQQDMFTQTCYDIW